MRTRNSILLAALACVIGAALPGHAAGAGTVVRYGIPMADVPRTTGQQDRGAGAYQFTRYRPESRNSSRRSTGFRT
jgi:peptide/nickel transport system substrate-binding protein